MQRTPAPTIIALAALLASGCGKANPPAPIPAPTTAITAAPPAPAPAGWGSLTGQFVYDGEPPVLPPLVAQGDESAKDAAVCSAKAVPDESLLVNARDRGISNICVYLQKAPPIHPDLKVSQQQQVLAKFNECRLDPHVLFVRTDQLVVVRNDDAVSHNYHAFPLKNSATLVSGTFWPNAKPFPVSFKEAEKLPVTVKCDIHPWIQAWWLVLDHPYAAVTDQAGGFTIDKLPAGDHEFIVWHERCGYIERKLRVTIEPDKATDVGARKLAPKIFERKIFEK